MPPGIAVEAGVLAGGFLQAFVAAGRAGAAAVQPVAVGVQAVLDVVGVNLVAVSCSQIAGRFPGGDFQLKQREV